MRTYDLLADLPLEIEEYELEALDKDVSSDFERSTTVVHLRGDGEDGVGENVVYDSVDQQAAQQAGSFLPLAGDWTLRSFARHLESLDLFPRAPQEDVSRNYRRWAYESAALDLALRQAGEPLHAVLGRTPRPVRFVVSLRLGEPPSIDPLLQLLERYPALRFKLDPTSAWDELLTVGVAQTGAVELIDFKGLYEGSNVEQAADPALYRRVVEAFTELGPGRGQIQYLASLFHPDAPNDVAPAEFNEPDPPPGLPDRELEPSPSATGFGWDQKVMPHRTPRERADSPA
jgi:L-alanine-DL-glutamate epimerase-like enolase superfamily enzyme